MVDRGRSCPALRRADVQYLRLLKHSLPSRQPNRCQLIQRTFKEKKKGTARSFYDYTTGNDVVEWLERQASRGAIVSYHYRNPS